MNNATFSPVTHLPTGLGVSVTMTGVPGVVIVSPQVTSVARVPLTSAVSLAALTVTLMGEAPAPPRSGNSKLLHVL